MIEDYLFEKVHSDIEFGYARKPSKCVIAVPQAGVNSETGLFIVIAGYGQSPFEPYFRDMLLPYIAAKSNSVVACMDYFGASVKRPNSFTPHQLFFVELHKHLGVSVEAPAELKINELVDGLLEQLYAQGVRELPPSCRLKINPKEEYHSFGLLPALDHLSLINDLQNRYSLDRRKTYVLGTSYGGYVALLMHKFAAERLCMIIDNSGFSEVVEDLFSRNARIAQYKGIEFHALEPPFWSKEPDAEHHMNKAMEMVRDLKETSHMHNSSTRIYSFHSVNDTVAPTQTKNQLADEMVKYCDFRYSLIGEANLDGRLFKNLTHGLSASLKGLFERCYSDILCDGKEMLTEVSDCVERRFLCQNQSFEFEMTFDHVRACYK